MAQVQIVVDSTACGSTSTTIHATNTGTIPYGSGISIDDVYSSVIPIGFNFNFYGNVYNQILIGSNGALCFDVSLAGAYDPWSITAPLAGNSSVYNSICGPWCDILVSSGGTIDYSTVGVAPNRKFVATFCGAHMFSCTGQYTTCQLIIYEGTNIADVQIAHKTICTGWNGGYAIVGVQNATGTASTAAPGRDFPATWSATNEGWRFTPNGTMTSYTVSSIPFASVPYATSAINWYDSTTGAFLGTGPSLLISPTVPTTYLAVAYGCFDSSIAYMHIDPATTFGVHGGSHLDSGIITNPTECGKCDGKIKLVGDAFPYSPTDTLADTVFYSFNGIPQPPVLVYAATDSSLTITGLCAGIYDNIYFHAPHHCPSNLIGPYTLVNPPITAAFTFTTHLGCNGDSVLIVSGSTPAYNGTCVWTYGDGHVDSSSANPLHVYAAQGTYNIGLLFHNPYGCYDTTSLPVTFNHPISSVFTTNSPVCLGVPISFTNTSVGIGATYSWTFGDGSTSTDMNPVHTYMAAGDYVAQLAVTDFIPCTVTSTAPIEIVSVAARTEFHDTTICLRDSLQLLSFSSAIPASIPVSYLWTPGNNLSDPTTAQPMFFGPAADYTYTFTVTSIPLGCTASDVLTIHVKPPLVLSNLTIDQTISIGSSVQLNADSALYYTWTPNDGTLNNPNINNPIATPTDSVTVYTVYGSTLYGCKDTASVTIRVDPTVTDFMPAAFTPNGDGLNDNFRVFNLRSQRLVDFRIFNRWGHEVFQTIDPKKGWDGTFNGVAQDMGVYNYQVIVAHPDGSQKSYTGTVTLIR